MVNHQRQLSTVFAALADPIRRRMLDRLGEHGEIRVTALAKPFRISAPAISRHLRVLEGARLIQRRRDGREHLIRVRTEGMKEAQKWMAQCAAHWDAKFDLLDELVKQETKEAKKR